MGSACHQLCQRYSGTLTHTAPMAIWLWETFTFFLPKWRFVALPSMETSLSAPLNMLSSVYSKTMFARGDKIYHDLTELYPFVLRLYPAALRKAKLGCNFGLSECNMVNR